MDPTPSVPLSEIPLREPPAGVSSNFVNPQTLAPVIDAVSAVMMLWALTFVGIRLYANTQASRRLRIEDYFCVIATILAISLTGLIISMNKVARHDIDIPRIWFNGAYWKRNFADTVLFGPTLFFAKGAILLLYLRIFNINKKMRYGIWLGQIWNFLLYWGCIPIATYYGTPRIGQSWDDVALTETCANLNTVVLVQGVLSVVLDLYIFVLPIPIVSKLQISLRQRLSILSIFGTGIFGIVAAVAAMVYRIEFYIGQNVSFWQTAHLYIYITCENYVAIIVSSMPAVASVSRGKTSLPSWLTSMRSLLSRSRSRSRFSDSLDGSGASSQSGTRVWPPNQGIITGLDARDDGILLHVYKGRREEDYELGMVTTEIRGAVDDGQRIQEEGVVRRSVEISQTTRLARCLTV